jgi:DNA-binding Lrp family transcriptional regulator
VLEAHLITGDGDVMCHLMAQDNQHFAKIIREISAHPAVVGSSTSLSLDRAIPYRVAPLITSDYVASFHQRRQTR